MEQESLEGKSIPAAELLSFILSLLKYPAARVCTNEAAGELLQMIEDHSGIPVPNEIYRLIVTCKNEQAMQAICSVFPVEDRYFRWMNDPEAQTLYPEEYGGIKE